MDLEKIPSLTPVGCFHIQAEVARVREKPSLKEMQRSCLPSVSDLLGEEAFAEVSVKWSESALYLACFVDLPLAGSEYPDFETGDAIEYFIDTRDLKDSLVVTKFCHHFLILPQKVSTIQALEISRFRAENSHPLCSPEDLNVTVDLSRSGYSVLIEIPRTCLVGFDPLEMDHIGFTYRIHRKGGKPQHFSVSSCDYALEQYPKLWSSLSLR